MKCKKCNKEFNGHKTKRFCSTKCKNIVNVRNKRRQLKQKALEYKGGRCQACGYNKCVGALTFHHLDPTKKEFGIGGRGETRSWEKIKNELDKCVLLCANCHAEEHERLDLHCLVAQR